MKKIFTLISMALVAMSVNAQDDEPVLYPYSDITWGDITWKLDNQKTDINDEAATKWYFVKGQGNAYKEIFAEEFTDQNDGTIKYRPYYTYIDYDKGENGIPTYGLYYKFTPKKAGVLKVRIWANKDRRRTVVAKGSTGKALVPHTDYTIEGYFLNEFVKDADGNNIPNSRGENQARYFTNDEIKTLHETEKMSRTDLSDFVIGAGNKAFWGWLILNVEANESYYLFQLSSQLGFGAVEFTPEGGTTSSYLAAYDNGGTIVMNTEFSSIVGDNNVVKSEYLSDQGSVVKIDKIADLEIEAVGSSTPTDIVPDKSGTGINTIKATEKNDANAPIFNLAGQKVDKNQKGILIQNGKKFVNK